MDETCRNATSELQLTYSSVWKGLRSSTSSCAGMLDKKNVSTSVCVRKDARAQQFSLVLRLSLPLMSGPAMHGHQLHDV